MPETKQTGRPLSYYMRNGLWYFTQPPDALSGQAIPKSTVEQWLEKTLELEAEITRLREQVEELKGQQVVANQSVFGIRNIRPYYSTLIEYNESPSKWGVAGPDSYQVCVFGGKEHHKVMAEECAARMNTAVERFYNKPYPQPSEQRITVE